MVVAIFHRRLKEGRTFEEFKRAWEADEGFGVPARVFTALSLADPRDVLTIGFVDIEPQHLPARTERVAAQERLRHDRIDDVIESTQLRAMYELATEHDFSATPREIPIGWLRAFSAASELRGTPVPRGAPAPWTTAAVSAALR
ncbi:MAG: hypothetical protein ACRDK9_04215 [Solirubrobacterales bacterium]